MKELKSCILSLQVADQWARSLFTLSENLLTLDIDRVLYLKCQLLKVKLTISQFT